MEPVTLDSLLQYDSDVMSAIVAPVKDNQPLYANKILSMHRMQSYRFRKSHRSLCKWHWERCSKIAEYALPVRFNARWLLGNSYTSKLPDCDSINIAAKTALDALVDTRLLADDSPAYVAEVRLLPAARVDTDVWRTAGYYVVEVI